MSKILTARRNLKMKNIIPVKIGIWETKYNLIRHRDKSVTIIAPTVKWMQDTGTLAFISRRIKAGYLADKIVACFRSQTIELPGYTCATLYNVANGDIGHTEVY